MEVGEKVAILGLESLLPTTYRRFDPEIPLQATYLARSLSTSGLIPTGFEAIVTHVPPFYVSKFHCRIIRKYDFKNSKQDHVLTQSR